MGVRWHINYQIQPDKSNGKEKLNCNIVRNKNKLLCVGNGYVEELDDSDFAMIEAALRNLFEAFDDNDSDLQQHLNIMEQTAEYAKAVRGALKEKA